MPAKPPPPRRTLTALACILAAVILVSLCLGNYRLSVAQIFTLCLDTLRGREVDAVQAQVLFQVRLPRVLTAAVAGAGLALSGVTLQGIFRNPLVDPHVIGVTAGSAFGGTLAIFFGLGMNGLFASTIACGLATLVLVFLASHRIMQNSLLMLILTGMILGGLFSALVSLLQYLSDAEDTLPSIVFWLMGSFASASGDKLLLLAVPVALASAVLLGLRWRLNLLSLGEREARALNVNIHPLRWTVIFCSGLIVACQVAVSGSIGWVGLIIPHLGRMLIGADHQRLLPCAMLLGAAYMIVVDDLARTLSQSEIPVSIITALLGAPVFAFLVYRLRRSATHHE